MDPNFAAAYADMAIAMSLGMSRNMLGPDSLEKAEWYARQAVRLDPNLPQAHLALGRVFVRDPERFRESVREVLAALRLNATDTHALNSVATYFVSSGDMQKAQCIGDRIARIDPSSNEVKMSGYWYVNAVDPEGALTNSKYALSAQDTEIAGHDIRANAYILQGNLIEAERETRAVIELAPRQYLGRSLRALIAAGHEDRRSAEAAIAEFHADAMRNHWAAIRVAYVYGKLGDRDKALEWVERSANLGHHSWYAMVKHPWLQDLQADPQFQKIVAKMKEDLDDVRDDVIGVYQLICG
jgi:tetratricopeptide (TPR) repeat protein